MPIGSLVNTNVWGGWSRALESRYDREQRQGYGNPNYSPRWQSLAGDYFRRRQAEAESNDRRTQAENPGRGRRVDNFGRPIIGTSPESRSPSERFRAIQGRYPWEDSHLGPGAVTTPNTFEKIFNRVTYAAYDTSYAIFGHNNFVGLALDAAVTALSLVVAPVAAVRTVGLGLKVLSKLGSSVVRRATAKKSLDAGEITAARRQLSMEAEIAAAPKWRHKRIREKWSSVDELVAQAWQSNFNTGWSGGGLIPLVAGKPYVQGGIKTIGSYGPLTGKTSGPKAANIVFATEKASPGYYNVKGYNVGLEIDFQKFYRRNLPKIYKDFHAMNIRALLGPNRSLGGRQSVLPELRPPMRSFDKTERYLARNEKYLKFEREGYRYESWWDEFLRYSGIKNVR